MTQTEQTPTTVISSSDDQNQFEKFVSRHCAFLTGKPYMVGNNKAIDAKESIVCDTDKLRELKVAAIEYGGTLSLFPKPRFLFPNAVINIPKGFTLLYLMPTDIEGGGPQPRKEIDPNDPETIELHLSLKQDGQLVPIQTYPSPDKNDRHRIYEGHRRHMVIFTMLQGKCPSGPGIWALESPITEQQAFEYAFKVNYKRKNLSSNELSAFIMELPKRFPATYQTKIHGFSFQTVVAKQLGLTQKRVSELLSAYTDVETVITQVDEKYTTGIKCLPEGTVRETRKAPDSAKPAIYEATVEQKLYASEAKELVKSVLEHPEFTAEEIKAKAEKIKNKPTVEETAASLVKDATKEEKRIERNLSKVVAAGNVKAPDDLMEKIYGHLALRSKNVKVEEESANVYAGLVFARLYERASEEEIEKIFEEVDSL